MLVDANWHKCCYVVVQVYVVSIVVYSGPAATFMPTLQSTIHYTILYNIFSVTVSDVSKSSLTAPVCTD
jgi:hypothetical protein